MGLSGGGVPSGGLVGCGGSGEIGGGGISPGPPFGFVLLGPSPFPGSSFGVNMGLLVGGGVTGFPPPGGATGSGRLLLFGGVVTMGNNDGLCGG